MVGLYTGWHGVHKGGFSDRAKELDFHQTSQTKQMLVSHEIDFLSHQLFAWGCWLMPRDVVIFSARYSKYYYFNA